MPDARQQLFFDFARLLSKTTTSETTHETHPPTDSPQRAQAKEGASSSQSSCHPRIRGRVLDAALTRQCRELVAGLGMDALARDVRVFWHSRLTTTAGLAHYNCASIDLNPKLREFQPEEPDRTMRHELAHLVAQSRAGMRRIQAHGAQWQQACAELGIPGEKRCHDLPLKRRRVKRKYAYQCLHCKVIVPRVRRLARHSSCYACCQEYNRGRYSSKFLLLAIPLDEAKLLSPEAGW
ncbi:MAG: SprT-like domain-containing protein [Verrucomicrobiales bacterium]